MVVVWVITSTGDFTWPATNLDDIISKQFLKKYLGIHHTSAVAVAFRSIHGATVCAFLPTGAN
jgi:hypothetical protein